MGAHDLALPGDFSSPVKVDMREEPDLWFNYCVNGAPVEYIPLTTSPVLCRPEDPSLPAYWYRQAVVEVPEENLCTLFSIRRDRLPSHHRRFAEITFSAVSQDSPQRLVMGPTSLCALRLSKGASFARLERYVGTPLLKTRVVDPSWVAQLLRCKAPAVMHGVLDWVAMVTHTGERIFNRGFSTVRFVARLLPMQPDVFTFDGTWTWSRRDRRMYLYASYLRPSDHIGQMLSTGLWPHLDGVYSAFHVVDVAIAYGPDPYEGLE